MASEDEAIMPPKIFEARPEPVVSEEAPMPMQEAVAEEAEQEPTGAPDMLTHLLLRPARSTGPSGRPRLSAGSHCLAPGRILLHKNEFLASLKKFQLTLTK